MNKFKKIFLCSFMVIPIAALLFFDYMTTDKYEQPKSIYQVYLDGNKVGMIDSKNDLYSLINKEQIEIKNEYKVDQVYPPKGFQIIKKNTYDEKVSSVETVYNSIKDSKTFTIKGYTITIKPKVNNAPPVYIYVIDDKIFAEAVNNIIETFIGSERYEQFLDNTQPEISDTGYIIENMSFKNKISIKESYISVDQKIYTNVNELTKFLLFGNNESKKEYTVKQGDSIEKIAEDHKLNTQELLIANDNINSEDTLLAIGEKVNVSLINPVLTLIYEEYVVEDVEAQFETIVEKDPTKYTDYSKVKQEGSNGINRIASRVQFINGAQNQGSVIVGKPETIRPVKNKIIVKGTKKHRVPGQRPLPPQDYIDTGQEWAWPTNSPYVITSPYGWRWGTLHDGVDISGTGYGSPIYAALDGVVVQAKWGGLVGRAAGKNVVIDHQNGYFTVYAHLSKWYVKPGQHVSRKQKIGAMGNTGNVTGTHLHFGLFKGKPYCPGSKSLNPMRLWK